MCLWWGLYELFIAVIIRGCICGGVYVRYLLLLLLEDVPLVGCVYFVFTRRPGESYSSRTRLLLRCLCDVFRALII